MNKILDIFYNQIIKEACEGRINCFLYFNMPFSTDLIDLNQKYICDFQESDELLIPTLFIKNKEEFDKLLIEYTNLALMFYDNNNYPEEILNDKLFKEDKICPEKMILTTLWSNATIDDFNNPIEFLKKRISFLKNNIPSINVGYIELLQSMMIINVTKDNILNETPYQLEILLEHENGELYRFPKIKLGIHDNKAYIYAIQNKQQEQNNFMKFINRKLYKVNENFYDDYEEENLKDITPSFLVAANITMAYLKTLGINEIIIPSILIERWNAKTMAIKIKSQYKNLTKEEILDEIEQQNHIWMNINNKMIRTFRRLNYHNKGIEITSDPFLVDSNMHIIFSNLEYSNNELLNNTLNVFEQTTKHL